MGDEEQRHASLGAQLFQQLEDLQPDRDVERRGRLVRDQQLRVAGERHRDHGALALAARELVRIAARAALGLVDADAAHGGDSFVESPRSAQPGMQLDRLDDLVADRVDGIERGHRLPEDHRNVAAAQRMELLGKHFQDFLPVEKNFAAEAGAFHQSQ